MKFTFTSATSFSLPEKPGTDMGRGIERNGERMKTGGSGTVVDESIYRSGSVGIDYVQYKPFIQIKL